jgi:hypothetical protein
LLQPLPIPQEPFEVVIMDFITGLPESEWKGHIYNAILVMVCLLTKYIIYEPYNLIIDIEGLAKLLFDSLVQFFTMPKHVISDQGSLFTSKFWGTICHYLGVKCKLSTAFHL